MGGIQNKKKQGLRKFELRRDRNERRVTEVLNLGVRRGKGEGENKQE